MPHATTTQAATTSDHRLSFESRASVGKTSFPALERFPDHDESISTAGLNLLYSSPTKHNAFSRDLSDQSRRLPRIDSGIQMNPLQMHGPANDRRHSRISKNDRRPSLSDALKTISRGRGSVSSNAHELADALKAPLSPKLMILCVIWYLSSALTSTSSKSILNAFPKPATLTLIQFALVAAFCLFFSKVAQTLPLIRNAIPSLRNGIRSPTSEVMRTTLPLAVFQIAGHLLSSTATAKIPVSLVHTIKGLSPLFTVLAYRFIFNIRYPLSTYVSLIPLTVGVMLACSSAFVGNMVGIVYALLAALIFVTQNLYSKRLFNEAARAESDGVANSNKLDKLNMLYYCSVQAFLLTLPIWFWSEGIGILKDFLHDGSLDLTEKPETFDHGRLFLEYIFNGTFHFAQNILAFVLLSMVSPVTYSVASLIKRVFVVIIAIIWFRNPTNKIQAFGIVLTFFGLYLYDRSSDGSKADRKAKLLAINNGALLPLNTQVPTCTGAAKGFTASPMQMSATRSNSPYSLNGYAINNGLEKRDDDVVRNGTRPRGSSNATWLPAGTRQKDTWQLKDSSMPSTSMPNTSRIAG